MKRVTSKIYLYAPANNTQYLDFWHARSYGGGSYGVVRMFSRGSPSESWSSWDQVSPYSYMGTSNWSQERIMLATSRWSGMQVQIIYEHSTNYDGLGWYVWNPQLLRYPQAAPASFAPMTESRNTDSIKSLVTCREHPLRRPWRPDTVCFLLMLRPRPLRPSVVAVLRSGQGTMQPAQDPVLTKELSQLLSDILAYHELQRFVEHNYPLIAKEMPTGVSIVGLADAFALALGRHGYLRCHLARELKEKLLEERPKQFDLIHRVFSGVPESAPIESISPRPKDSGEVDIETARWPEAGDLPEWPVANHSVVRKAFSELLTEGRRRYVALEGQPGTGKTLMTRCLAANAAKHFRISSGRFDFKGTTGLGPALSAFAHDLDVLIADPNVRLEDGFTQIVEQLKERRQPTLLIFDSYEMSGAAEAWIERQLLPSLVKLSWLRVVIAGQRTPASENQKWAATTSAPLLSLKFPEMLDWYLFARAFRAHLPAETFADLYRCARGRPDLLSSVLKPGS